MAKKEFKFDFFLWSDKGLSPNLGLLRSTSYKITDHVLYLMYMCKQYTVKRTKTCFEKLNFKKFLGNIKNCCA